MLDNEHLHMKRWVHTMCMHCLWLLLLPMDEPISNEDGPFQNSKCIWMKSFTAIDFTRKGIKYFLFSNNGFCYASQLNLILIKSNINSKWTTIICHIERSYKCKRPNNFEIDLKLMFSRLFFSRHSFLQPQQKKHYFLSSFALDYIPLQCNGHPNGIYFQCSLTLKSYTMCLLFA